MIARPLRDRRDSINTRGGASLVANLITPRHRPICDVSKPVGNGGAIALAKRTQHCIATASTLRRIGRDECGLINPQQLASRSWGGPRDSPSVMRNIENSHGDAERLCAAARRTAEGARITTK